MIKGQHHSEEWKKKMSERNKGKNNPFFGKHHTQETKEKFKKRPQHFHKGQISWNKGKSPTKETIEKQKETHKKTLANPEIRKRLREAHKGQIGWMKGKHHSEETKRKLSKANQGKHSSMKGKTFSEEIRKKMSKARKGKSPWNKGIPMSEEAKNLDRERILKLFESGKFPRQQNTKPERQIKEELLKRGYKEGSDFIHQYKFRNKFMCDFCFPQQKVIIEADGDFWHANPKKYPAGSFLHPHQIKDIGRDRSRNAYIMKVDNGSWKLIRFWESDIKKDVVKCVDKIEEVLIKNIFRV